MKTLAAAHSLLAAALPSTAIPVSPLQSLQNPLTPVLQNQSEVLAILFCIVAAIWLIYSGVLFYHWVRYGQTTGQTVPALVIHFVISLGLLLMAASGFA